jgi:hypothetical protein
MPKSTSNVRYYLQGDSIVKGKKKNSPGIMEKDGLALPALHAYAHVQHCQVQRNPLYVPEFGLTDGKANKDPQVAAIREDLDVLAGEIRTHESDFSHPKHPVEIRECIEDATANRAKHVTLEKTHKTI